MSRVASLTAIGLFLCVGPAFALSAEQPQVVGTATAANLQHVLSSDARLHAVNEALWNALGQLRATSGVKLAFSPSLLPKGRVSCECLHVSVRDALERMRMQVPFAYAAIGDQIVIEPIRMHGPLRPVTTLAYSSSENVPVVASGRNGSGRATELQVVSQTGVVAGRVVDDRTQGPVDGAHVTITGTGLGALTDGNGRFRILQVPVGTATVSVERIGYRPSTEEAAVRADEMTVVNFALSQLALALDEIVVTGTPGGTQRRAIGNVVERTDVTAVLDRGSILTTEQVLQSRMAGVTVVGGHGIAGLEGSPIRIRGSSSPGLKSDPIVYIDGVRMSSDLGFHSRPHGGQTNSGTISRLNDINPADIENIEVIKGPAAATLYGTEASNGVISITTKRGVSGAPTFDVYTKFGANWLRDAAGQIDRNWGRTETGEIISVDLYQQETERLGEAPFGSGPIQEYGLSVRGGAGVVLYSASINRAERTGFVDWNWTENTSARMSLSAAPNEKFDVNVGGSYIRGNTRYPGGANFQGFIRGSVATLDGPQRGFNPYPVDEWRDRRREMITLDRVLGHAHFVYTPRPWWRNRLVFGGDVADQGYSRTVFMDESVGQTGSRRIDRLDTRQLTADYSSTATFRLTEALGSATSAGFQYHKRQVSETALTGNEWAVPALTTVGAAARTTADETYFENASVGVYVQQQFDIRERIYLTAAVRADDNSAFGSDFDAAIYPKLSATWVLHEEPFWQWDFINQLRLRGAWGMAGQQPDIFAAQRQYRATAGPGDQSIMTPLQFGNPNLGPERGQELELGFDTELWNDRVVLAFTRYWKTTKDAIVAAPVAPSHGFPGRVFQNVGQVSNWGSELTADVRLFSRDATRADLGVTFATTHSRVDDLGGIERLALQRARSHVEGYPLGAFYFIRVLSADFESGDSGTVINAMCDGGAGPDGRQMGGDPVPCSDADRVYWGRGPEPTWTVNVNPTLILRSNWRLAANIHAQGGNLITMDYIAGRATSWVNSELAVRRNDPIYEAYRQFGREPIGFTYGGFSKLREVSLQYTLPDAWAERVRANRLSVNLSGRDLALLWSESKGRTLLFGELSGDPEKTQTLETRPERAGGDSLDGIGEIMPGGLPPLSSLVVTVRVAF